MPGEKIRFRAQFCCRGCIHHLGVYSTADEAGRAWDEVCWTYRKDVSQLNFSDEVSVSGYEAAIQNVKRKWDGLFFRMRKVRFCRSKKGTRNEETEEEKTRRTNAQDQDLVRFTSTDVLVDIRPPSPYERAKVPRAYRSLNALQKYKEQRKKRNGRIFVPSPPPPPTWVMEAVLDHRSDPTDGWRIRAYFVESKTKANDGTVVRAWHPASDVNECLIECYWNNIGRLF